MYDEKRLSALADYAPGAGTRVLRPRPSGASDADGQHGLRGDRAFGRNALRGAGAVEFPGRVRRRAAGRAAARQPRSGDAGLFLRSTLHRRAPAERLFADRRHRPGGPPVRHGAGGQSERLPGDGLEPGAHRGVLRLRHGRRTGLRSARPPRRAPRAAQLRRSGHDAAGRRAGGAGRYADHTARRRAPHCPTTCL